MKTDITAYPEGHGQSIPRSAWTERFGATNEEGERLLETMQVHSLFAVNTGFEKIEEQRITYRSGNHKTQIDYMMVRKEDRKGLKDATILPLEAVTRQHRLLVIDIEIEKEKMQKPPKPKPKISLETERKRKRKGLPKTGRRNEDYK